jgi:glycosyltransferase involved in cell wall biosynthesis
MTKVRPRLIVPSHLIVHQYDPTERLAGGIHGFITDLIRLAPPEHEFRVIGVDASGRRALGRWETVTVGAREVGFLPVARLSAGDPRRFVPHTVRLVAGLLSRRRHEASATLLHAHRVEVGAALHLAHPGNRLVQFVHTDSEEAGRHRTESFWRFLPRIHDLIERSTVRSAYRAWVLSEAAAARLTENGATNVRVGRNWFDEEVFHPAGPEPADDWIGWVGRLEPSKNPVLAVETLSALRKRGRDSQLWLAGSGSLERPVRRAIERLGLCDSVQLLGTVTPQQLADRLRRTRALLVTSLWEGQPRAVLEALGCGTAVVSRVVGDVPTIVEPGRTGFISDAGTAPDLARLLARLGELAPPSEIAGSVDAFRGSVVVRFLFDDMTAAR